MLPEHQRDGRLWIDDRLIAAFMARGHATPTLEWCQSTDDIDPVDAMQTLSMKLGTTELRMRVLEADLDHVVHDEVVQARMAELLDNFLDSFERRSP